MDTPTLSQPPAEEISIEELRSAASRAKSLIASFILICTLSAGLIAWLIPKTYTASVVLAPSANSSGADQLGRLGSLASQFGGLSALTGISMMGTAQEWDSVAVLESEALTQKFIAQNDLLPVLFPRKWNAVLGKWKSGNPKDIPTLWQANRLFKKKIRSVTVDDRTGLITLTIKWRNPAQASDWANSLVKMTNDYLRSKAIAESERSIAFLNAEASQTTLVEAKQAIFTLLEVELNKAMLARGNDQYAFKVLDPAFPPEKPSSLPYWAWMLIALASSAVLSFIGIFLHVAWNKT